MNIRRYLDGSELLGIVAIFSGNFAIISLQKFRMNVMWLRTGQLKVCLYQRGKKTALRKEMNLIYK